MTKVLPPSHKRIQQDERRIELTTTCVCVCAGARAMRQLLPPLHQLPEGQDAHRPGDRRAGVSPAAGHQRRALGARQQPRRRVHPRRREYPL